jgi:pheromone shutdown protein TraB
MVSLKKRSAMRSTDISTATVEERATSVHKISVKSGLAVLGGLLVYFFAMSATGLLHVVELRVFNFVFLLAGILYSINKIKNKRGAEFNYFEGLAAGFLTTLYAVIPFAAFIFVYLWKINPHFMQYINESVALGKYLNPALAAHAVLVEGIISGAVMTFISMQYFKRFAKRPR